MKATSGLLRGAAIGAVALLALAGHASAGVVFDETIDGPLSSDANSPTLIDFAVGANTVVGTMGPQSGVVDFFSFVVEAGETLESVVLDSFSGGNISRIDLFVGPVAGPIFTGFAGASFDTTGTLVTGPIGPGTYSVTLQESNTPEVSYGITFTVSAAPTDVPEPAVLALMLAGLAGVGLARRRTR